MIELGTGSAASTARPEAFYERWIDHDRWPEWSPDTEWVRVDGPVRSGVRGVLKPKGGPRVKFIISALEENRRYADTGMLPGARLIFDHIAVPVSDRTELTARVTVSGPLARIWALILGGGFRKSVQADLDRLVHLVETSA